MTSLRIFFVGGRMTYRALFYWLTPQIYVPSLLVAPIFQILLFVYIGRSAGLESDEFYVIGNAIQYAAIPCLFAMTQMIGGERYQNTLSAILVSPARRVPLFFGRSLPVIVNGAFVSAFSLTAGVIILGIDIPASAIAPLALVIVVAAFSCTGLGLINAALSLRIRENAVLSNVIFGFLLIFTGANVPLSELPEWAQTMSDGLPFTHAIEAARELADGASLGDVAGLVGTELFIGVLYAGHRLRAPALHGGAEPPLRHAGTLVTRNLRLLGVAWLLNVKQLTRSQFDGFLAIAWPLFFATVAFFMFEAGGNPDALVYAALGAAVMGIWTATSVSAGSALQRERWFGTLELLVAAPAHFSLVLLPLAFATSAIGVYCMATTLLWGRFVFGIDIPSNSRSSWRSRSR